MQNVGTMTICWELQYCKLEIPMIRRQLIAASGLWKKSYQSPCTKASCFSISVSNTQLTTARCNSCKALELIVALLSSSPHKEDSTDASQMELAQAQHQYLLQNIHFRNCLLPSWLNHMTPPHTKILQELSKEV